MSMLFTCISGAIALLKLATMIKKTPSISHITHVFLPLKSPVMPRANTRGMATIDEN